MQSNVKNSKLTHPGPQIPLFSFSAIFSLLFILTSLFFLLTIYALLKQNYALLNLPFLKSSFEFLDVKTSCTLFATFLGLLLVRHHFIVGLRPRIVYECSKTKSSLNPELENKGLLWQVKITNAGLGAAAFLSYKFRIGIEAINHDGFQDFNTTIKELEKYNFLFEKNYFLGHISNGGAMRAGESITIFEVLLPEGYNIKQLDLRIIFEGYLGGRYRKDVYLIPRLGIPNRNNNQAPSESTNFDFLEV